MFKKTLTLVLPLALIAMFGLSSVSCNTVNSLAKSSNPYSTADEIKLGQETDAQLKADTKTYRFLKSGDANYSQIVGYVNRIKDKFLAANDVPFEGQYNYQVQVVNEDVLNAFATTGGYLYMYTGIMKFLDNEAQLAGVIGHEMGHISNRHITNNMTAQSITGTLASVLLGDKASDMTKTAAGLAYNLSFLKYSRFAEEEADQSGAEWMVRTDYNPYEMQGFFKKMQNAGGGRSPEFLSTHPDPASRVQHIGEVLGKLNARNSGKTYDAEYQAFKRLLP
ncbi:MAG: M48 family metalloprotease [Rhizobacter sp.]|nr:M48 family metalloprotease [Chlorobiales bacterium]